MAPITIPFTGPSYKGPSEYINAQECVDYVHVVDSSGGKATLSLMGRYGLDPFSTLGASAIRGRIVVDNVAYAVASNKAYKLLNDGTWDELGTLDTSTGQVGMAQNGLQVMIVDGTSGYIITTATAVFAKITDPGFYGGNDVCFQNGFFIVDNLTLGTVQCSALRDGSTWNSVDRATPEGDPDGLVRAIANRTDLILFGESTTEAYYYAALPYGFPYLRMQGGLIDMGLAARWGACRADNTVYWLAQNKEGLYGICRMEGYQPVKISTPALDYEFRSYASVLDCEAWSFTDRGHTLIYFTFPTGKKTWCYDSAVGLWHEVRSYGQDVFRCNGHMFLNNRHLLSDRTTGKFYEVNWNKYADDLDPIEYIRTTQYISKDGIPLEYNSLEIFAETGYGPLQSDNVEEPTINLSWSDDNGKTFSNELSRSLGWAGEYKRRVVFTNLGTSRNRCFRIRSTSQVRQVITGAVVNLTQGVD